MYQSIHCTPQTYTVYVSVMPPLKNGGDRSNALQIEFHLIMETILDYILQLRNQTQTHYIIDEGHRAGKYSAGI